MGKNAKAGKPGKAKRLDNQIKREIRAAQKELEQNYAKAMFPVAIQESLLLLMAMSCLVLHDDYGFGKKRLGAFGERLLDLFDSIENRYVTIDEVIDEITRMTGLRYALSKEDVKEMEDRGLYGLIEEIKLKDAQQEFWKRRRAQGWESTVNRYGEEIAK